MNSAIGQGVASKTVWFLLLALLTAVLPALPAAAPSSLVRRRAYAGPSTESDSARQGARTDEQARPAESAGHRQLHNTRLRNTVSTLSKLPKLSKPPKVWQNYPLIPDFGPHRAVYRQFLREVAENKQRWAQSQPLLPILLYVYKIKQQDSIFSISAKTSISVESIATLNRLEHPSALPYPDSYILLPNNSGIFLPETQTEEPTKGAPKLPTSPKLLWEQGLAQKRGNHLLYHRLVVAKRLYRYYPRSQFSQAERRQFLDNTLRSPVQQALVVTSGFGPRRDPLSSRSSFHDGLDIRSAYGASVYSIAAGRVVELGQNKLYGLFVSIRLDGRKGQVALYGHLTAVLVRKGQGVNAGEVIGNSGNSGRSTGPHLHLSIFQNGTAIDPEPLLRDIF